MEEKAPMGEFEFLPPTPEEIEKRRKLELFRDEIISVAQKEAEILKAGQKGTGHFGGIILDRHGIQMPHLEFAEKIKDGTVTMEDATHYKQMVWDEYQAKIASGVLDAAPFPTTTESAVMAFLANRAAVVIGRRQLDEIKRAQQSLQ